MSMSMSGEKEIDSSWTTTISTQVMAQLCRIENLPKDLLREIVVRVAKSSTGAVQIAGIITLSKSFRQYSVDGDVLRVISFRGLSAWMRYSSIRQYEDFLEADGLVTRSAIAGNPTAQILFAKVIMISASTIVRSHSAILIPSARNRYFLDRCRTFRFITHFSDYKILFDMIKVFISEANAAEVNEMNGYLEDFVKYFHGYGRKTDPFLISVLLFFIQPKHKPLSNSISSSVYRFNRLCSMVHNALQNVGGSEEEQQHILRCLVQKDEPVEFETLIERLDVVLPIIELACRMGSRPSSIDIRLTPTVLLFLASNLRGDLEDEVRILKYRTEMLSEYHALFYM